MLDHEVYNLLIKIDDGYKLTQEEERLLASLKNIRWHKISQLPKSMTILSSLTNLDLSDTKIDDISILSGLKSLTGLDLDGTLVSDISALSGLIALTDLSLYGTKVIDISVLSGLTALTNLNLGRTSIDDISAISSLKSLTHLCLRKTRVSDISALSELMALTDLDIDGIHVSNINALSGLTALTNLDLSHTGVSDISMLTDLKALTKLGLIGTNVKDISVLSNLIALEKIYLSGVPLNDISVLGCLKTLRKIDLRYSTLPSIPESLLDLKLDFNSNEFPEGPGIYIYGLKLKDQPFEIFSSDRELIRTYFREHDKVPVNECKVVFLGDPEAGKTHSIRRLLKKGKKLTKFNNQSTPGIEITVDTMQMEDSDIVVNYWDFGGQEIQHSMHRMFLTKRTIYVVFLNARQDPLDDRARYWLENINSFAKEAPVLLIINKIDQNDRPKFNEYGIRNDYGNQIKKIVRMSALEDEPDIFMKELQGSINEIIRELPTVSSMVPRSWKTLMEDIRMMPDHYLSSDQFLEHCKACNIQDYNTIHDDLVDLFQVIGISFCYYKNRALADYMLLNPKWLVNAIYP